GAGGSFGVGGSLGGCNQPADCSCQSFVGHTYWFCTTPTGRDAAQTVCAGGGLDLVRIDDRTENAWVFGTALGLSLVSPTGTPIDLLFTGANDSVTLDDWQWQDGTLFWSGGAPVGGLYSNWAGGSPQSSSARRCGGMLYTGEWQARSCTALQPFVCEGP
ncbi:MAG TPA: C-type lectin domain-containing protein, partial [Polyangiaceae bacterium]|nr:C-type lectin domain-containing protein [Polyangiaceae bacterium]